MLSTAVEGWSRPSTPIALTGHSFHMSVLTLARLLQNVAAIADSRPLPRSGHGGTPDGTTL